MKRVFVMLEDKDAKAKKVTGKTWEYLLILGLKTELENMKRAIK